MHQPIAQIYTVQSNTFIATAYPLFTILLQLGSNTPNNELGMDFAWRSIRSSRGKAVLSRYCTLNFSHPDGRATNALDNVEWYDGPSPIFPGGIAGDPGVPDRVTVRLHDGPGAIDSSPNRVEAWYEDYVMFRPDVGGSTNNYFVPVGILNWSILGVASYHQLSLEIDTNQIDGPIGPQPTVRFPVWESVFTNR